MEVVKGEAKWSIDLLLVSRSRQPFLHDTQEQAIGSWFATVRRHCCGFAGATTRFFSAAWGSVSGRRKSLEADSRVREEFTLSQV